MINVALLKFDVYIKYDSEQAEWHEYLFISHVNYLNSMQVNC
jgi:hypothetical protein